MSTAACAPGTDLRRRPRALRARRHGTPGREQRHRRSRRPGADPLGQLGEARRRAEAVELLAAPAAALRQVVSGDLARSAHVCRAASQASRTASGAMKPIAADTGLGRHVAERARRARPRRTPNRSGPSSRARRSVFGHSVNAVPEKPHGRLGGRGASAPGSRCDCADVAGSSVRKPDSSPVRVVFAPTIPRTSRGCRGSSPEPRPDRRLSTCVGRRPVPAWRRGEPSRPRPRRLGGDPVALELEQTRFDVGQTFGRFGGRGGGFVSVGFGRSHSRAGFVGGTAQGSGIGGRLPRRWWRLGVPVGRTTCGM